MRNRVAIVVLLALVLAGGAAFAYRGAIRDMLAERAKPELPPAQPYQPHLESEPAAGETREPVDAPAPEPETPPVKPPAPTPAPAKEEANLAVPFMSQAPHANWDMPYQEACEEASLIMLHAYLTGAVAFTPDDADRRILEMVAWEEEHLGFYKDTTAEETARIAREYYGHAASRAVALTSMDQVKKEIDAGHPVILPAAGKRLPNPYFSGDGPLYHMLVVKGYTKDGKIITNDPGTRRGADFLYDEDVLWDAVHDWNGGDVDAGAKVMVVVEK